MRSPAGSTKYKLVRLTSGTDPEPAHSEIIGEAAVNGDNRKSPVRSSDPRSILNRFLFQRSSQAKDNKMTTIARLIASMQQNYALIMDADKNPLMMLPPAQRFQIMVYLSLMWTTIFCAAFGIWIWYGQILAFHMLILGIAVTGMMFEITNRTRRRTMKVQSVRPSSPSVLALRSNPKY